MALNAKAIARLATLVKDHRSTCLCVTAENGVLRKQLRNLEGKTLEVVASAKQLHAKFRSLTGKRDALVAKYEELALEVQFMLGLSKKARSLRARKVEREELPEAKAPIVR